MGYATANIQSIAGTDSNMYLKSALPAINLDTAHTIENISSAFNNNSTYQDPIYGVSINGTWDQKTASSAGTLAELKSITFGTQVPVSTMFSVFTGIEQNSSSLAGVVGSTLLTNSVYNTAGYQLRPDGTLEQSAWSTGTSPYSMPQSSLINSSAATCPSAALTSHCWTTAAGNGQSGLAYFNQPPINGGLTTETSNQNASSYQVIMAALTSPMDTAKWFPSASTSSVNNYVPITSLPTTEDINSLLIQATSK